MERIDGRQVGERLRAIRRQKGLSLHDVEARSDQEFKASVLGAYERGERAISVPRLLRLAELYRVPPDQLLPRGAHDLEIDLTEPARRRRRRLHHRPRAPARDRRRRRRGDRPLRRDHPAAAPGLQRPDAHHPQRRPARPRRGDGPQPRGPRQPARRARPPRGLPISAWSIRALPRATATAATLVPTCQHRRRPRSRSSYRATTSWWACSVSATNCCASCRTPSPSRSTCAGNEITIRGDEVEADRVGRLFEEMVALLEAGHVLDPRASGRSIQMLKADQRPTDVLTTEVLRGRKPVRPKTVGPEALRRRRAHAHRHVRDRPGRHRQELPRGRARGAGAAGEGDQPHHPHPPRGRGRRAPRLPPRRHPRQGRPVPAPALRRALRHARARGGARG